MGAGAERRCRKNRIRGCLFQLFGPKVPRCVGARAGPGHLWCQWWMPGWSPPQMRMLSGSLGAKQSKSDVIWGGECVPMHQRTKHEGRISRYDHGNSSWRYGKHFCANVAKSFKNQCETEGAGSHQSLWKPFRFWFGSLTFWTEVLALQSVTSWCQNWRSGAAGRRVLFLKKPNRTFCF